METIRASSCSTDRQIKDRLRNIIKEHVGLEHIEDSTDLYSAGMSSQGSVVLMIAVEAQFGLEFPDALLSRDVFANIDTIAGAIKTVQGE